MIGLAEGADVGIGLVTKGSLQFRAGLLKGDALIVARALQLVERGADHQGNIIADAGKGGLERLLQEHLTIRGGSEAPHHRGARPTGANTGSHRTLTSCIEVFIRYIFDFVDSFFVKSQFLQHGLTQLLCHRLGVDIEDGTTHDDSLVEESLGLRHAHQRTHLAATT